MTLVRTTVTIPQTLMDEVDALAGPRGRSAFVSEAIEARVKRERLRRALDRTRGIYVGTPFQMSSDEVYRWVREQREGPDPWQR
jgi:metal-responsive CopG/Arc/MetJ family transcriptional regulator